MNCISCNTPHRLHLWRKLLLCESCKALAEKAAVEIDQRFLRARQSADMWLEEFVCEGKLLAGGSGINVKVER